MSIFKSIFYVVTVDKNTDLGEIKESASKYFFWRFLKIRYFDYYPNDDKIMLIFSNYNPSKLKEQKITLANYKQVSLIVLLYSLISSKEEELKQSINNELKSYNPKKISNSITIYTP